MGASSRRRRRSGIVLVPPEPAFEPFSRPDSTSGLGVAPNGQTWVEVNSIWGIEFGEARFISRTDPGEMFAYIETSASDVHVKLTRTGGTAVHARVVGRVVDSLNYYLAVGYAGGTLLYSVVNGVNELLDSDPTPFPATGTLGLLMVEDQIALTVNGVIIGRATDTAHNGTKHGIGTHEALANTNYRFDNFDVIPAVLDTDVALVDLVPATMDIATNGSQSYTVKAYNNIGLELTGLAVSIASDDVGIATSSLTLGVTPFSDSITGESEGVTTVRATVGGVEDSVVVTVGPPLINFTDPFDRANSATTMGQTPSGLTWLYHSKTVWGIDANRAYQVSQTGMVAGEGSHATVDTGQTNAQISIIWRAGTQARLVGRLQAENEYYLALMTSTIILVQRVTGPGTGVTIGSLSVASAINDKLGMKIENDKITIYKNDVEVIAPITDTIYTTGTRWGIGINQTASTAYRFDDFNYVELAPAPPTATTVEITGGDVTDFLVGEDTSRSAVVKDQFGNIIPDEDVTWASADELVFTVDPVSGAITAVGAGGPTLLTASSGAATPATVNVTVTARAATTITRTPLGTLSLLPNESAQLIPRVYDQHGVEIAGATVAYDSLDDDIVIVDADGLLTGVTGGQTTINITSGAALVQVPVDVATILTVWQEADIYLGGDGTGQVIYAVHAVRNFTLNINNEVVEADTEFGAAMPMTIVGTPVVDPLKQTITNPTAAAGGIRMYTAYDPNLDLAPGATFIVVGAALPSTQALFYAGLDNATHTQRLGVRRLDTGAIGAQFYSGGGPNISSTVPQSSTLRSIFAMSTGTNFKVQIPQANAQTGSGTAHTSSPTAVVWFGPTPEPAAISADVELAATIVCTRELTATEVDYMRLLIEEEFNTQPAPAPGSGVGSITLNLTNTTITTGNTRQLTWQVLDDQGNPIQASVQFSSANSGVVSVSVGGLLSYVSNGGPIVVTATVAGTSVTDTVNVTCVTATATSISISPTTSSIQVGQTKTFVGTVLDQAGFVMSATITYTSLNTGVATVNSSTGVATGVSTGAATIRAASGAITPANATLNVVAPSSATTPNEPSGFILLNDRPYLTKHPPYGYASFPQYPNPADKHFAEGWDNTEGRYPNFTVIDISGNPQNDGRVGKMYYPTLSRSGVAPAIATYTLPPGVTEIYISQLMWYSPNWIGNTSRTNKTCFYGLNQGNNQLLLSAHGRECGRLTPRILFQGVQEIDYRSDYDASFQFQDIALRRGVWTNVEMRVKLHSQPQINDAGGNMISPASADGEIDLWVGGIKQQTMRNLRLAQKAHPTRAPSFSIINWSPTYGGGGRGVPKNFVNTADAQGIFTVCRQYMYDQSLLPPNQRGTLDNGQEQGYHPPAPEFAIDPADEGQTLLFDRCYLSYK